MVDLDEFCRQGNRDKIQKAESTENTGKPSGLKSLKCDVNFACIYMTSR